MTIKNKFDIKEVKEFIENSSKNSIVYIGADSERFRKKNGLFYAEYTVAVVVHHDGKHGAKIFGKTIVEKDYDQKQNKPSLRLMNEVYKAAEMYLELAPSIGDRKFEVHLDINEDILYGSSCVLQQAIGYVKSMCNVSPKVKPNAFAASCAADRFTSI